MMQAHGSAYGFEVEERDTWRYVSVGQPGDLFGAHQPGDVIGCISANASKVLVAP